MIKKLGGRKALMAYLSLLIGTFIALIFPDKLSDNLIILLLGVVGAFSVGNASEHLAEAIGKKRQEVNIEPLKDTLAQVRQRVDSIEHQNSILGQSLVGQAQAIQTIAGSLNDK